jgi:hypothetical protein
MQRSKQGEGDSEFGVLPAPSQGLEKSSRRWLSTLTLVSALFSLNQTRRRSMNMNMKSQKLNRSIQAVLALGLLGGAGTAAANECAVAAVACALSGNAARVACAAATIEAGANPAADVACAGSVLVGVVGCGDMWTTCPKIKKNPRTVSAGRMGQTAGGSTFEWQCPEGAWRGGAKINRLMGLQVRVGRFGTTSKTYVSSVLASCADGTRHTFIGNGGIDDRPDSFIWRGKTCKIGQMLQGLQAKDSTGITALGGICDPVGKLSVGDKDNVFLGLAPTGTTIGVAGTGKCKEGTYMSGLKVWYNQSVPLKQRYLKGLELLCKTYK